MANACRLVLIDYIIGLTELVNVGCPPSVCGRCVGSSPTPMKQVCGSS